ncbi:MAG TPA: PH domain-containing protein [Candidatus Peribacteraceae bacterium]|nr:PH domain-containing protein [Candidatus Peribacteraceae bacterium]
MVLQRMFDRHLNEDEEILEVVHRHWLAGFKTLALPTLAIVGLLLLFAAAPTRAVAIVTGVLGTICVLWWVRNFFDYYLDAWILTDEGIIDVAWHGWFHRTSSRVLYSDLQGVSYEIKGFIGTLLRHGRISVEKISTGSEIAMEDVAQPRRVEEMILKNMEEYLHSNNLRDASAVQELLSKVVAREMGIREVRKKRSATAK